MRWPHTRRSHSREQTHPGVLFVTRELDLGGVGALCDITTGRIDWRQGKKFRASEFGDRGAETHQNCIMWDL